MDIFCFLGCELFPESAGPSLSHISVFIICVDDVDADISGDVTFPLLSVSDACNAK